MLLIKIEKTVGRRRLMLVVGCAITTSFYLECFVPKDQSDPSERIELAGK